jgi:putative ABC transport system substrate-binding protein
MNRTRRGFISLITFAFPGAPLFAWAQRAPVKAVRIGVLRAADDNPIFRKDFGGFRQGLGEGGYVEGTTLTLEYRVALGSSAELLSRAQELTLLNVDALLAIGSPVLVAAAKATATIPIVAVDLETDPLAAGFVRSLVRPGGNITGVFLDFPELSGKWLEFLKETVPRLSRVAVLWDKATGRAPVTGAEDAARLLRLQLQLLEVGTPTELERVFQHAVERRAGAALVLPSPLFNSARKQVADLMVKYRLPAIMPFPDFAADGGLMGYGPHLMTMFQQTAAVMVKVLRGVRPAEIPVERPSRFEFIVNLTAAKVLGLTMPKTLLARADKVLQ